MKWKSNLPMQFSPSGWTVNSGGFSFTSLDVYCARILIEQYAGAFMAILDVSLSLGRHGRSWIYGLYNNKTQDLNTVVHWLMLEIHTKGKSLRCNIEGWVLTLQQTVLMQCGGVHNRYYVSTDSSTRANQTAYYGDFNKYLFSKYCGNIL